MNAIGKIESFNEKWETYVERVEQLFLANHIDDNHQVPTLVSLIGSKTHTLMRFSDTRKTSYKELPGEHHNTNSPKPLEIAECFREGEAVLTYVANLKKLPTHGDGLVCGLRNVQQIKCLLSEAKLKYSKTLDIAAIAMETAIHDASELQSEFHPEQSTFDKIYIMVDNNQTTLELPSPPNPTANTTYRCGGDSHVIHNCRFKDQTCYHCGKVGHTARVCRLKLQGKPKQTPKTLPQNALESTLLNVARLINVKIY